jgi:Ca2+-binding RTX toxin-like protein
MGSVAASSIGFRVSLDAGQAVRLNLVGASGNTPMVGSRLVFRSEEGGVIAQQSRSSGTNAFEVTVQEAGVYYIDVLSGESGDYVLSMAAAIRSGTIGADTMTGGNGADHLRGLAGDDRIDGMGGNDTLEGGDGTDTLIGGNGDDFIYGCDTSADLRDVIFGGDGNDWIDAGWGNDEVHGGNGNDTIDGSFGSDTLIGNAGNDVISGGQGSDQIFGGPGDDFINGGFGFDRLNGGTGADTFFHVGNADHASDWIQDYNAAEGDVLQVGIAGATRAQFQVNTAFTAGAGAAGIAESFVIYRPTGQILFALVDGAAQDSINLRIGGQVFDLLE